MRTGTPSVKPFAKGVEGEEWEALYCHCRELKQATGAKKPSESQKAKALWAMIAARDKYDEFYYPAHRKDIQDRARTRLELWEEHFKKSGGSSGEGVRMFGSREIFTIQLVKKTLQAEPVPVWSCGKNIVKILTFGFADCRCQSLCLRNGVQRRWFEKFAKDVGRALLGRGLAFSRPMGCCGVAHNV